MLSGLLQSRRINSLCLTWKILNKFSFITCIINCLPFDIFNKYYHLKWDCSMRYPQSNTFNIRNPVKEKLKTSVLIPVILNNQVKNQMKQKNKIWNEIEDHDCNPNSGSNIPSFLRHASFKFYHYKNHLNLRCSTPVI